MTRLSSRDHEVFTVIFVDNRYRVIECLEMFRRTIDGASVCPMWDIRPRLPLDLPECGSHAQRQSDFERLERDGDRPPARILAAVMRNAAMALRWQSHR